MYTNRCNRDDRKYNQYDNFRLLQFQIIVVSSPKLENRNLWMIPSRECTGEAMSPKQANPPLSPHTADENVNYIRQMLGELRTVANNEGADMLRYLIEMAYVEAGDIQSGLRPLSIRGNRDAAGSMPLKPPGKIKF